MKRVLMAALGGVLAAGVAADGPHDEGAREGHPAKRAAEWLPKLAERLAERRSRGLHGAGSAEWLPGRLRLSPYKPRRWVFEGPGGECRVLVAVPFAEGDHWGEPCPDGYRLPWRRGRAER